MVILLNGYMSNKATIERLIKQPLPF